MKEYGRAIQDSDKAIQLDPTYAGAYYNRSLVFHQLKNFGRAIEDSDKAIRLNPD